MLRDPTARAYSQYQMIKDTEGTPEQLKARGVSSFVDLSFDQAIADEMTKLEELGINPDTTYVSTLMTAIVLSVQ